METTSSELTWIIGFLIISTVVDNRATAVPEVIIGFLIISTVVDSKTS